MERAAARRLALAIAASAALCACIAYRPSPLPTHSTLRVGVDALSVDISGLRLAPLKAVRIDPAAGLRPVDVAVLAVLNSPDLVAKRAALRVPAAQVFAAGLLPDPQIAAGVDQPIAGPDTHTAVNASPSIDIAALLQRASAERAAKFTAKQANLDELWAEWTTAQQARQFAETALANAARARFLSEVLAAASGRASASEAAMGRGDATAQTAAVDLAAKVDAETQLAAARSAEGKARRDLNALIGLRADVALPLVEAPASPGYDPEEVRRDLASLPERRPDLLALKAGYGAEDANLRKAIVAQFPVASIAFAFARDPTPTTTLGLAAVFALPIFNAHRGEVRVQQATRAQLRAEYQARLDQAESEATSANAEHISARAEAAALASDLPRLDAMLKPAPAAFARGDIDSGAYLALVQAVVSKEADLADRELAARIAEIQLETALFAPPASARAAP